VVDDDSDDDIIQDFVWEDMDNYKGQRENFTGSVGPQGAAKEVTEIVDVFELFFNSEVVGTIVEETNRYAEQFLRGHKLSSRSAARAWKPVKGRNLCWTGPLYAYGQYSETCLEIIFHHKRVISTPGFGDIITRHRLELICKFLHFANKETINSFRGPKKLFKNFPVISHRNNKIQELYLPNRDISIEESLMLWKGPLSFKQYLPLKASKFGIETCELCDAITGYLWSLYMQVRAQSLTAP
jgi:hypothetical protein